MSESFRWCNDETVVVRTQMAIAIYLNPYGELVIRQEGQMHPDEDVWVVIAPDNVPAVIEAMQEAIGTADAPATVTKDPTAANRQRRHRDRHRDGVTPVTAGGVTDRDSAGSNQGGLPLAAE
jgi:hypothetical protein